MKKCKNEMCQTMLSPDSAPDFCPSCQDRRERYANVIAWLSELKRQKPEHEGEAERAIQIIRGSRPGVTEKYDALLMKLDRSYSRLTDKRDHFSKTAKESPLAHTRQFAKAKVAAINVLLTDLQWMKARNRDMIQAVASTPNEKVQP